MNSSRDTRDYSVRMPENINDGKLIKQDEDEVFTSKDCSNT